MAEHSVIRDREKTQYDIDFIFLSLNVLLLVSNKTQKTHGPKAANFTLKNLDLYLFLKHDHIQNISLLAGMASLSLLLYVSEILRTFKLFRKNA